MSELVSSLRIINTLAIVDCILISRAFDAILLYERMRVESGAFIYDDINNFFFNENYLCIICEVLTKLAI